MGVAAAQADAFYRELIAGEQVYGVRDDGGFPAPMTASGVRALPFWSKRSRAQRITSASEELTARERRAAGPSTTGSTS